MWRGISLRKISLLLFGPMLMETVVQMFLAWMVTQATLGMGHKSNETMWIPAVGAVSYILSSLFAGKLVTPRIAARLIVIAPIASAVFGIAAFFVNSLPLLILCTGAMGICVGQYYVPFQIHMTHVRPFKTLAWSISFYTIAWGIGASIGPYTGAYYRQADWYVLTSVAGVMVAIHTLLNYIAKKAPQPTEEHTVKAVFVSSIYQRLAGWSSYAIAGLLMRGLSLILIPELAKKLQWTDDYVAFAIMMVYLPIPIGAVIWASLRFHLERPIILLFLILIGGISFFMLPFTDSYFLTVCCIFGVGLASSCAVFHSLYYANAAPQRCRSTSVGIAEAVAGFGALAGPIIIGLLIMDNVQGMHIYATGGIIMAMQLGIIIWCTIQHKKNPEKQSLT